MNKERDNKVDEVEEMIRKSEEREKEEESKKTVRVEVPFSHCVSYIVRVKNPDDIEEVQEALRNKDPSDWEYDPFFYEHLGEEWWECIREVKKEDIEEAKNVQVRPDNAMQIY